MTENKNQKYKFLKSYLEEHKNIAEDDAITGVECLFEELPVKVRQSSGREDMCNRIKEEIKEALDEQLQIISKCPFFKIEITNQEDEQELKNKILRSIEEMLFMQGFNAYKEGKNKE